MRLLEPLRERDFRLLWLAMAISLFGDGVYLVALAWAVYDLRNEPSALALAGFSFASGMLTFGLIGGVVADRFDRRHVMIGADLARAVALAAAAALALAGWLELWHLAALAFLYGAGDAFFGPAYGAIMPSIVPKALLVRANALQLVSRPLALRAAGPAVGGVLVATVGTGGVFLLDAGTFLASAACILAMRIRPQVSRRRSAVFEEIREGFAFVRSETWLWATLLAAAIALLVFFGPLEVLTPYIVRNDLHASASVFGAVLAAQGAGSVAGALWMGARGMPRRPVTFMYLWWGIGTLPLCGFAFATEPWHLMVLAFGFGFAMPVGLVVWSTLMQTRVPPHLLGRVTSIDWMLSLSLVPVSFALVGPVQAWIGVDATFVAAGLIGGLSTLALLIAVPGLRERSEVAREARVGDGGGVHPDDLDPLPAGHPGDGAEHGEAVVPVRGDRPAP